MGPDADSSHLGVPAGVEDARISIKRNSGKAKKRHRLSS